MAVAIRYRSNLGGALSLDGDVPWKKDLGMITFEPLPLAHEETVLARHPELQAVRLVVPAWEGNLWVKWLRREETSKYTELIGDGRSCRFTSSWTPGPSSPVPRRGLL